MVLVYFTTSALDLQFQISRFKNSVWTVNTSDSELQKYIETILVVTIIKNPKQLCQNVFAVCGRGAYISTFDFFSAL